MVSKFARGAFLIFMGLMLVAYLLSAVNANDINKNGTRNNARNFMRSPEKISPSIWRVVSFLQCNWCRYGNLTLHAMAPAISRGGFPRCEIQINPNPQRWRWSIPCYPLPDNESIVLRHITGGLGQ